MPHGWQYGWLHHAATGCADHQYVSGGGDGVPESQLRPPCAKAAVPEHLPQRGRMRHRTARDIAAADFGHRMPGLPFTHAGQARHLDHCRQAAGGACQSCANRCQLPRPVLVVFRRHPPVCTATSPKCTLPRMPLWLGARRNAEGSQACAAAAAGSASFCPANAGPATCGTRPRRGVCRSVYQPCKQDPGYRAMSSPNLEAEMGFSSRLLVPRSVRRAMHPGRAVKRAVTPTVVKKASRAMHPVDNAVYSMQRSVATTIRSGRKRRARVYHHGNCPISHRSPEAAARCKNP
jgi:hypothetical protein